MCIRWTYHPATRGYERRLCLSDGRAVQVRPIIPGDQARLREAFQTADTETLYRRFLGNPPHLTAERLAYWCTVDYRRRFALVACDRASGESVAVARYEPVDDGVAVVVDPRWRRIGVATALVEMLAEADLERGVHSFGASYLAGNQPVAALVGLAGVPRIAGSGAGWRRWPCHSTVSRSPRSRRAPQRPLPRRRRRPSSARLAPAQPGRDEAT